MSTDYIPHSYDGLAIWLNNFTAFVSDQANMTRLGIAADKINALLLSANQFIAANTAADEPNAGSADLLVRSEAASAATNAVRYFVNSQLRYNDAVTDQDRVNMGLTVPDHEPTPAPVPVTWPVTTAKLPSEGIIEIHYVDSASPEGHRAKPAGVHGAEIRHAILTSPPTSDADLINSDFSTRSPHRFTYNLSQRGQTVYFRLRWENTRGQKGPWAPIVSAIVP
ncbi:MAG: hypothetical protein LBR84_01530 [Tannerella sp.]|jgi:hypothetical protein|nr:hypothetical protein [Tannerella sp.]